jgi:hypothetical protein
MRQMHILRRLMVSGGVAAALFAVAGLSASAQDATTTTTTTTSSVNKDCQACVGNKIPTSATPEMIQEACQRQKARTAKFLQSGIREEFGSENPFTYDKKTPCS